MVFDSKDCFQLYLKKLVLIGVGSQAVVFLDKNNNKVYKIFHQYFDENGEDYFIRYSKDELLRFSYIKNRTFIWPSSVIVVEGEVVGYLRNYVNSKPLCEFNPLKISLDKFINAIRIMQKDIDTISNYGVLTYDLMYNTLYGSTGFKVIDQEEYSFSSKSSSELIRINNDNFNYEVMYFLVDCFFNEFINDHKLLKEMYTQSGIDILKFIELFRNYLSEYIGRDVTRLIDAKICMNKNKKLIRKYERNLFSQK